MGTGSKGPAQPPPLRGTRNAGFGAEGGRSRALACAEDKASGGSAGAKGTCRLLRPALRPSPPRAVVA